MDEVYIKEEQEEAAITLETSDNSQASAQDQPLRAKMKQNKLWLAQKVKQTKSSKPTKSESYLQKI